MGDYRMTTFGIVVCLLVFDFILVNSAECPPPENTDPCFCNKGFVHCTGVSDSVHLKAIITKLKGYKIRKLALEDSTLGDVPGDLFEGSHIEQIKLVETEVTSLGDENNAPFTGLENSMKRLSVINERLLTKPLRLGHLKKMNYLYLGGLEIPNLGNDWFSDVPEGLEWLIIDGCGVNHVGSKAFTHMKKLKSLTFVGNNFTLPRSVLPENAINLKYIELWNNGIQEIPSDFFKGMPALNKVDLYKNALTSLPQDTWESIWPQLTRINLSGNPWVCDSKMKWIVNQSKEIKAEGSCAKPQKLKGRYLSSLKVEDLE